MKIKTTTPVDFPRYSSGIDYRSTVLCLGSCFAENMTTRLAARKFNVQYSPFGIQYHPLAISEGMQRLLEGRLFTEKDLVFDGQLYHSWQHHGRYSAPNLEVALRQMNTDFQVAQKQLKSADWVILTLGTARVFEGIDLKRLVNNCHKFPAAQFTKRWLSVDEITTAFQEVMKVLLTGNKNLKFIFTVSPIRHMRGGMIQNQRSKSRLQLAVEQLTEQFQSAHYFPAYEYVLDELRDYRYFAKDLVHPSELAVDLIFEKFAESYFSNSTIELCRKVEKIQAALKHRPFYPRSMEHQRFLSKLENQMKQLMEAHPELDFSEELIDLNQRL